MAATPFRPGPARSASPRPSGLVADGRPLSAYDFLRPAKLPREHLRTLQVTYETFAHRLGVLLTSNLRVVCRVELTGVEQRTAADHLAAVAPDQVAVPVALVPLPGSAALGLSRSMAMTWVDHMLGGTGGEQPQRQLSDIEVPLVRDLLADVVTDLGVAFGEFTSVSPIPGALEYDPALVQPVGPADALVVATFELSVGAATSDLWLSVPLQALQPALHRHHESASVTTGEREARSAARDQLTEGLHEVPVEVSARLAPARMCSADLLDLRLGDVVALGHPVDRPMEITTAGVRFGRAVPTGRGAHLTCQVVSTDPTALPR